jgi:hypothetical protein
MEAKDSEMRKEQCQLKAAANKLTLLFLDASHFVMGCDFLR